MLLTFPSFLLILATASSANLGAFQVLVQLLHGHMQLLSGTASGDLTPQSRVQTGCSDRSSPTVVYKGVFEGQRWQTEG